ncbi:hypothetical protein C5S35_01515 [Candidatus Methanophagaceae archaeon]|nr:hypothetical protein C5S35_01515 [Methanophagales archaeon]
MEKKRQRHVTTIFIVVMMIASVLALSMPALADKGDEPKGEDVFLGNAYLGMAVMDPPDSDVGRFTIGTTGGDPTTPSDNNKILLYGHPYPWSSFTTIRIDGSDNVYGSSGTMVSAPYADGDSIVSAWTIGDIKVTQRLTLVTSSSGYADTAEISYTVENQGSAAHSVGTRVMMDTMLGNNDAAPFSIPGEGDITTETEFTGTDIPTTWFVYDSLSSPTVTALGTLKASGIITPDRFTLSNWMRIWGTVWDFAITPGASNGDSAVGIWWYPTTLDPGASRTYTTYYGIGYIEITPGVLTVGLTSDPTVHVGDTFTVTAFVENTGGSTANGVTATIALPTGLSLASGETATKTIGDLSPSGTGLASWDVVADGTATGDLTYTVTAESTTSGIDPTIASKDVTVLPVGQEANLCPDEYRWNTAVSPTGYEWDPFPALFRSWNDVHFVNNGPGDAFNVEATISYAPANVVIVDGDVMVGDIPAGSGAWSSDFFELEVDMTNPQDPNEGIEWRVEYDDAGGNHHVVENVPEFCMPT